MKKQAILNMKNAALAFGALLMSAGFAACSDKDVPAGGEPGEEGIETVIGSSVSVNSDADDLTSKFVTNYKINGGRGSRAGHTRSTEEWKMPELPASFDGMIKVEAPSWKWGSLDGGENFYVAAGDVQNFTGGGLSANNQCNLYIYGTLILPSFAPAQGINIFIADGGKLEINGTSWVGGKEISNGVLTDDKNTNLYIYEGGTYVGNYTSASKTGLYVDGSVETGKVEFGGIVRIGGNLTATELTTNNADLAAVNVKANTWTYNNNSKVNVEETVEITGDVTINAQNVKIKAKDYLVRGNFHMENNSELYAYAHLNVGKDCEISTQGKVYTPCLYVQDELYIKNSGTIEIPNYIRCDGFRADASGWNITMGPNSLINAHSHFTVENKGWALNLSTAADAPSAVVADTIQIMEGQAAYIKGHASLSAKEYWGKPSENTQYYLEGDDYKSYITQGTVKVTIEGVTVNSDDKSCEPDFGTRTTPPTPPTITELISSINHTHDISATCVALNDGKAYLSWHKRGTSIHGCLEALKVENDTAKLTSWMEVDDGDVEGGNNWDGNSAVSGADAAGEKQGQFDFNHLIVANRQVVTVGDNAKMGGFIGAIALDGAGDFGTSGTLQDAFKARQLLGSVTEKIGRSGNCVLYANGKYYIACAGGFQEYNGNIDSLFVKVQYKNPTSDITGYWAANLGDYELTAGSAKHIAINPAGDKVATLELTSKGTHAEGDDYWFNDTETAIPATLKVRSADNWLKSTEWSAEIGKIAPIYGKNAIAMDDNGNVYVAAGRQGLLVYQNGNKVGGFDIRTVLKGEEDAGANGVAIDSKYVYVAYGIGGLWILNKSDLSVVSWYKSNAPEGYSTSAAAASANYVAVDGQYIYVAYGRHGVKVLKLND